MINLNTDKTYFIIQARTGSTRLPEKMIKPFVQNNSIPEIIINRFKKHGVPKENIIIATTNNKTDDKLVELLNLTGCKIFRGDENNVLKRFIDAAMYYNADEIIRICADNPFINMKFISEILDINYNHYDYTSFYLNEQTPAIKTHFGFFAERVQLNALKKTIENTKKTPHLEHVTPYIYENPQLFTIKKIKIPEILQSNQWLRLTIDTKTDFEIASNIFSKTSDPNNIEELIQVAKKNNAKDLMIQTIKENTK